MSPVDFILGIRDVVIERVERGREIHVWARPARHSACIKGRYELKRRTRERSSTHAKVIN